MISVRQRKERDLATIAAIVKYVLIFVVIAALVYGGLRVFFFLMPIFIGLVIARAAMALADFVLRRKAAFTSNEKAKAAAATPLVGGKARRRLSLTFYLLLFLVLICLIYLMISVIVGFLTNLATELPNMLKDTDLVETAMGVIRRMSGSVGGILGPSALESIETSLQNMQANMMERLPDLLSGLLAFIAGLFSRLPVILLVILVTIMSGYYFIKQTDKIYLYFLKLIPDKIFVRKSFEVTSRITTSVFRIGGGYIALMIAEFIQAYIGFLILGLPNAITWAVIVAIVDLMPILGSAAVMIPLGAYYLINGQPLIFTGMMILLVVMNIVRRVIEPPILGTAMQLHPVIMVLAMIAGIAIMGVGGLLVAPIILVILREIYLTFDLESKLRNTIGQMMGTDPDVQLPDEVNEIVIESAAPPAGGTTP